MSIGKTAMWLGLGVMLAAGLGCKTRPHKPVLPMIVAGLDGGNQEILPPDTVVTMPDGKTYTLKDYWMAYRRDLADIIQQRALTD